MHLAHDFRSTRDPSLIASHAQRERKIKQFQSNYVQATHISHCIKTGRRQGCMAMPAGARGHPTILHLFMNNSILRGIFYWNGISVFVVHTTHRKHPNSVLIPRAK